MENDKNQEPQESIQEIIKNMDYIFDQPFSRIPDEDMDQYLNDEFHYLMDLTVNSVLAHKTKNIDRPAIYLFQEKDDAEIWNGIGTTAAEFQDHKIIVESDTYSSIKKRNENVRTPDGALPAYKPIMLTHEQAQELFQNYRDSLRTMEIRAARSAEPEEEDF